MLKLYGMLESGNCYKIRLLLHLSGQPFEWVETDILAGESRTREFLKKNANGRVPVVELDDGSFLAESNAILWYLGRDTAFVPSEPLAAARCLQWMFFEQYSHEPYIATSRFWLHLLKDPVGYADRLAEKREPGHAALRVMEDRLANSPWIAGGGCSVADIALYAYTHVAPEGGFDLSSFAAIGAWLARVEALPGYSSISEV